MEAQIVKKTAKYLRIQVDIPVEEGKDMLTKEETIQIAVNEAGKLATQHI